MLGLALYVVTAISLPKGMTADVIPAVASVGAPNAPPTTLALSRGGSLGVIVQPTSTSGAAELKLLVIRGDGTRVTLPMPTDAVLSTAFSQYALGPHGEHIYPGARFDGIALANDGTPLATVAFQFSGAISGIDESVFIWNGERWRHALPNGKLPIDTSNLMIAAADVPSRFVCNGNYANASANLDAAQHDPHYQENQALWVDGHRTSALGFGSATATRGRFVVGYSAGGRSITVPGEPTRSSEAWEWTAEQRVSLGPGIAYGVNESGDAVGDNDRNLNGNGLPMLWRHDRAIRLSDKPGTAYAISDDGTIVGEIGGRAFVVRGGDAAVKLMYIDKLVRDRSWHITAAYAIAASGRILAAGRRRSGPLRILLLDPVQRS